MRRTLVLAFVMAAVVVTGARRADACSVEPTYIAPTNVELVASSPRIVIAKAIKEIPGKGDDSRIELRVTSVIRGAGIRAGESITVRGSTFRYFGASKKTDFARARKGAYAGSCTAWDYKLGKLYLVMLEQYGGGWDTRGLPFTRVNEEVDEKNDPWTIAVTEYARIAALPNAADRKRALAVLVARGVAPKATPTERAIADDVTTHLVTPTPGKPFAELEAMYRTATAVADQARIVMAIASSGDPAARAFMATVLTEVRYGRSSIDREIALEALAAYYDQVSDPPTIGIVADLYVLLGTQTKHERWPLMALLIKRADAKNRKAMEQALVDADDEEAGRLAQWFVRFPSTAAMKNLEGRLGGAYGESAKFELTLGLAGMGNRAVFAWAKQLAATKPAKDDDRWVAFYAIARSPLPEADALVPAIIARDDQDLETLIQGYEEAKHAAVDKRLAEISARPKLSAEATKWLARTLAARKAKP